MDRGIPTEEVLEEMRKHDPPVYYLVGTPKGRLSEYEKSLTQQPWQKVRDGVDISRKDEELRFSLRKDKLRAIRLREGRYLLRTNLIGRDPAQMWTLYTQLVQVEEAFKNLKGDLALRPIHHQKEERIEAHIFVAFLAYTLHVTLRRRLLDLAPGLTPRVVLEKFSTVQMIDVHLQTTDNRTVIMPRYTKPDSDLLLLLKKPQLSFPDLPPPKLATHLSNISKIAL